MPAPDVATLLDFEAQLDAALTTILSPFAAAPFSFEVAGQQAGAELIAPYLDFACVIEDPVGPAQSAQLRSGAIPECAAAYGFKFSFRFVCDRTKTDVAALKVRGTLRNLFLPRTGAFNATTLPYLVILMLGETGARRGVLPGDQKTTQLDVWDIDYAGQFAIREDAWPS